MNAAEAALHARSHIRAEAADSFAAVDIAGSFARQTVAGERAEAALSIVHIGSVEVDCFDIVTVDILAAEE